MGFDKRESEQLLTDCGRRCCICGKLHSVQLHHIKPKEKGGTDEIDNAIPLCPNCHNEVHTGYSPGRTTKIYSETELRLHRQRTVELVIQHNGTTGESTPLKKDISEEFLSKQHNLIFSQLDEDSRMLLMTLRLKNHFNDTYALQQFIEQIARYVTEFLNEVDNRAIKYNGSNVFLDHQIKVLLEKYFEADLAFLKEKLALAFPSRIGSSPMTNAVKEGETLVTKLYERFFLRMFDV
jgi:hypothetical protein